MQVPFISGTSYKEMGIKASDTPNDPNKWAFFNTEGTGNSRSGENRTFDLLRTYLARKVMRPLLRS